MIKFVGSKNWKNNLRESGMLEENDIKEEISYGYIHTVSAMAGFSCDRPKTDRDSVDAIISAKGKLVDASKFTSPRIEIQSKATTNWQISNGVFSFPLPKKNYDDLRGVSLVPRYLVVFCMPAGNLDWVAHSANELTTRNCAYWCNLRGLPDSTNTTSVTISVPIRNLFSHSILWRLMVQASMNEVLQNA
jgi:hypothetical protein